MTIDKFKKIFPNAKNADVIVDALNLYLSKYGINTEKRVAAFIAQCGHESGGFTVFSENLNYSADGLNKVFPKYFKNAGRDANQYARQPEKIANVIYAGRMGNTSNGDGWKYRGRGPIQITGKDNYSSFSKDMGVDALKNPDLLLDPKIGILSAIWFWNRAKLNELADVENLKEMTRKINGGYNGLDDRIKHYNEALVVLSEPKTKEIKFNLPIKKGSKGEDVKIIQKALNITDDGDFGPGTERVVKEWQTKNKLVADGIIGEKSLKLLIK